MRKILEVYESDKLVDEVEVTNWSDREVACFVREQADHLGRRVVVVWLK